MEEILKSGIFTVVPSPEDTKDYVVSSELVGVSEIQDFVVNGIESHVAYNQGATSMCVGFGTTGVQSQIDVTMGKPYQRYSPASVYGNRYDYAEHQGEGQHVRSALKDWHVDGMSKFEDFPFVGSVEESKLQFANLPKEVRDDMLNHRISAYYRLNHNDDKEIYNTMVEFNAPIVVGYYLYGSVVQGYNNGGILPTPDIVNEKNYGGHCSYIAGYKIINGVPYRIIVNSWGDDKFDRGIMYMPLDYPIFEAWLVRPYKKKEIRMKIGQKSYSVNGEVVEMDTAPVVRNQRTLVPLRFLMMELDALKVIWKQSTQTALVYYKQDVLYFKLGNDGFDSAMLMGKIPYETEESRLGLTTNWADENNRLLVPVRKVFEFCGWQVDWDGDTQEVILRNY